MSTLSTISIVYLHASECFDWARYDSLLRFVKVVCTLIWCFFVIGWFSNLQIDVEVMTTIGMHAHAFIVTKDESFPHSLVYGFNSLSFIGAMWIVFVNFHDWFCWSSVKVQFLWFTNVEWYFPFAKVSTDVRMLFFVFGDVGVKKIYFKDCFAISRYFVTLSTTDILWEYYHHQVHPYFNEF